MKIRWYEPLYIGPFVKKTDRLIHKIEQGEKTGRLYLIILTRREKKQLEYMTLASLKLWHPDPDEYLILGLVKSPEDALDYVTALYSEHMTADGRLRTEDFLGINE